MAKFGSVRRRIQRGRESWLLDFRGTPGVPEAERYLTSDLGSPFPSPEAAAMTLEAVRELAGRCGDWRHAIDVRRLPERRRTGVPALVEEWLRHVEASAMAPYSKRNARHVAGKWFSWWRDRTAEQIDTSAVHTWVEWMRAEGAAPKSRRNYLAEFKGFVRWLSVYRGFQTPIVWPTIKVPRQRRGVMTFEARRLVLRALDPRDRGIFLALALTLRPGEARAALMRDYDWTDGVLRVCRAAKGQYASAPVGPTKTGEERELRLPDGLRAWIAEHRNLDRLRPDAPLFPNPNTGRPYSHGRLLRVWRDACEEAGVDYLPPYRSGKHSTVTGLLEGGEDPRAVSALAGISDEIMDQHYDLERRQRRDAVVRKLEE